MSATVPAGSVIPVAAIRRFVRPPRPSPVCEVCAASLRPAARPGGAAPSAEDHGHLLEGIGGPGPPGLRCVCDACRIAFDHDGAGGGRRRSIPRTVIGDPGHDPAVIARLASPVSVLYVTVGTADVVVAYPGPAGIATATVEWADWDAIRASSPLAASLRPHVEGLLCIGDRAFRVGIDRCHALTASLRGRWEGLDGGPSARAEIGRTVADLTAAAIPLPRAGRIAG